MDIIKPFDPWDDPFCTCPKKYSLNPYTGCSHSCIYCYISSYIPHAFECRPKKNLLLRVKKDIKKAENLLISMSNSSDPYPPIERDYGLTRDVLKILCEKKDPLLIVTKSDIITRDLDILKRMPVTVTFTITTLDLIHRKLEPNAPSPKDRLNAIKRLRMENIPVGVRLDPVIPGLNLDFKDVIREAANVGATHIISSTFKPRPDGWKRFKTVFPEIAEKLSPLYFERGEVHRGTRYLPPGIRKKILEEIKNEAEDMGLSFACCREGFSMGSGSNSCDGSHLLEGI